MRRGVALARHPVPLTGQSGPLRCPLAESAWLAVSRGRHSAKRQAQRAPPPDTSPRENNGTALPGQERLPRWRILPPGGASNVRCQPHSIIRRSGSRNAKTLPESIVNLPAGVRNVSSQHQGVHVAGIDAGAAGPSTRPAASPVQPGRGADAGRSPGSARRHAPGSGV